MVLFRYFAREFLVGIAREESALQSLQRRTLQMQIPKTFFVKRIGAISRQSKCRSGRFASSLSFFLLVLFKYTLKSLLTGKTASPYCFRMLH